MDDAEWDSVLAERALYHLNEAERAIGYMNTWRGSRRARNKVGRIRRRVMKAFRLHESWY